jgi:hypothetical protein
MVNVPTGCSSWMVKDDAIAARQFYSGLADCNYAYFKTGVSRIAPNRSYNDTGGIQTQSITHCCAAEKGFSNP